MKIVCGSSLDRISELPSYVRDNILKFLSLRDAARTSVLSRTWRYQWTQLSQLVIDETTFIFKSQQYPIARAKKIAGILWRSKGPVLKFTLDYPGFTNKINIDTFILQFLLKRGIQELNLSMRGKNFPKIPSIFSCLHLKHLSLHYCQFIIPSPPTFKGFRELISLELTNVLFGQDISISGFPLLERLTLDSYNNNIMDCVSIDAPNLKFLSLSACAKHISILNSPLLAILSLSSFDEEIPWDETFDLIKFFGCLPLIENLYMFYTYLVLLAVPKVPKKLPTLLNCLRILTFEMISLTEIGHLSRALCLIRSSPNLQKLKIKVLAFSTTDVVRPLEYINMQDHFDFSLNKLQEEEIQEFTGLRPDLEFFKFLLAIPLELETLHIKPLSSEPINSGYEILFEFTRFRRASQKVEIIVLGQDGNQA